jgi:hypothetical protein
MDGAGASSAVSPPRFIPHIQSLYCHSSDLHSDAAPYRGQNQGLETAVVATSSAQGYSLTLPGSATLILAPLRLGLMPLPSIMKTPLS